jgi:holo-ACP synthase
MSSRVDDLENIKIAILEAKERRWNKELALIEKYHQSVIILKFNIPSWPKQSENIQEVFPEIVKDFEVFLEKESIGFIRIEKVQTILGPEAFYISKTEEQKIKTVTKYFEEEHPIGRLLDIDLIGTNKKPIERRRKRRCYLCNDLAINCMISRKHQPEELRAFFDKKLAQYSKSNK